jgi:hypothetical protein
MLKGIAGGEEVAGVACGGEMLAELLDLSGSDGADGRDQLLVALLASQASSDGPSTGGTLDSARPPLSTSCCWLPLYRVPGTRYGVPGIPYSTRRRSVAGVRRSSGGDAL